MQESSKNNPGLRVTLVGAVANLVLTVLKFVGGTLGHSMAMIADAFHSLSDLLTDAIVLFTHSIGKMPADADHPYGHGRAETIGTTIVGSVIILAGIGLGYEVWKILATGDIRIPEWIAAVMAALSLIIKEALYHYTHKVGEQLNSPVLKANAWHHRSDAISSVAALIGIIAAMYGYPIMDPIAGGVVALMISKVGYDILIQGLRDLMDTALSEEQTKKIREMISNTPGVLESHELRTRRIGGEIFMDAHILVDNDLTVTEGHKIAETVRRQLIQALDGVGDVLVHVDAEDDSELEQVYSTSREDLQSIIDPVFESMNGQIWKTGVRIHYLKGKHIVDVFVQVDKNKTIRETETLLEDIKNRLQSSSKIDVVRTYLDLNTRE